MVIMPMLKKAKEQKRPAQVATSNGHDSEAFTEANDDWVQDVFQQVSQFDLFDFVTYANFRRRPTFTCNVYLLLSVPFQIQGQHLTTIC